MYKKGFIEFGGGETKHLVEFFPEIATHPMSTFKGYLNPDTYEYVMIEDQTGKIRQLNPIPNREPVFMGSFTAGMLREEMTEWDPQARVVFQEQFDLIVSDGRFKEPDSMEFDTTFYPDFDLLIFRLSGTDKKIVLMHCCLGMS